LINLSLEFNLISSENYCTYITDGTHGTHSNQETGKYLLSAKDILDGNVHIKDNSRIISEDDFNKIHKNYKLENYDVLLTVAGTIGRTAIIKNYQNNYTFQRSVAIFKTNDKIKSLWLYYYLNSPIGKQIIKSLSKGTTQLILPLKDLRSLKIPVPKNISDQKKILSILTDIDKKIEINKRINQNLFNIIDVIFKVYVGDYEDLEIVPLSENTKEIIRGFNSKYVEKSNIKNFNQKVNKGTFLEKQHFKYLDENIEIPKVKFAKKRDVLLNSLGDGTVGRPHYYNEDTDNVVVDQHITIIRANEDLIPSTYIYEYLKNSTGQYHLDSLISGSTGMLMLNISEIRNLKIPILDKKNLREFDTTVTPLFDKITKNFEEIYELSKLRDTLLPKLMSGEIDVSKINYDLIIATFYFYFGIIF